MSELASLIAAFERMDIEKIRETFLSAETKSAYGLQFNFNYLAEGMSVLEALGNTQLKSSQESYVVCAKPLFAIDDVIVHNYSYKFVGNKTKHYLSLNIEVVDDIVVSWYDNAKHTRKKGVLPLTKFQIVCIDFDDYC